MQVETYVEEMFQKLWIEDKLFQRFTGYDEELWEVKCKIKEILRQTIHDTKESLKKDM